MHDDDDFPTTPGLAMLLVALALLCFAFAWVA
jgi:hypothetical protein